MPQRETLKLLQAIEDFNAAYAGDPKFSKIVEQLGGLRSSVEKVSSGESEDGERPERDTPGARASSPPPREESPFGGKPSDEARSAGKEADGDVKDKARAVLDKMRGGNTSGPPSEDEDKPARSDEDSGKEEGDRSKADIPGFLRKAAQRGGNDDARDQGRKKKRRMVTARR